MLLGTAAKVAAEVLISKLFTRSGDNDDSTQLNQYKELDEKFKHTDLPEVLSTAITPKENFTNSIGQNQVDSEYKSLYESLAEDSKKQVDATYAIYDNLNEKIDNINSRIDVISENQNKTSSAVSAYGQVTNESAVHNVGLMSKIAGGAKTVLSSVKDAIIGAIAVPLLGIKTAIEKLKNDNKPTDDNFDDMPYDPNASESAAAATEQADEEINNLEQQKSKIEEELDNLSNLKRQARSGGDLEEYNELVAKYQEQLKGINSSINTQEGVKEVAKGANQLATLNKLDSQEEPLISMLGDSEYWKRVDRLSSRVKTMNEVSSYLNSGDNGITTAGLQSLNELKDWLFDPDNNMTDEAIMKTFIKDDDYVTVDTIKSLREAGELTRENITPLQMRALMLIRKNKSGARQEALSRMIGHDAFTSLNSSIVDQKNFNKKWDDFRVKVLGKNTVASESANEEYLGPVDALFDSYENDEFKILDQDNNEINLYQMLQDVGTDRNNLINYKFQKPDGTDITNEFVNTLFPNNTFAAVGSGSSDTVLNDNFTSTKIRKYNSGKDTTELAESDETIYTYDSKSKTSNQLAHLMKYDARYADVSESIMDSLNGDTTKVEELTRAKFDQNQELKDIYGTYENFMEDQYLTANNNTLMPDSLQLAKESEIYKLLQEIQADLYANTVITANSAKNKGSTYLFNTSGSSSTDTDN